MTDLLPCPFCGASPNCGAAYGAGEDEPNAFCFECPDGCSVSKERPTYEEAIVAWNTRTPHPLHHAQRAGNPDLKARATDLWATLCLDCNHAPGQKCDCLDDIMETLEAVQRDALAISSTARATPERNNRFCKNDDCPWPDCLVGSTCPSQPASSVSSTDGASR